MWGWGSGAVYWLIWLKSEQIIEKFASPGLRSRSRAIFSSPFVDPRAQAKE